MARYQIWNGIDSITTMDGREFTAEEWANEYPWAKEPGAKMIITAGLINGGAAMEYEATVEHYKRMGADITDGMTDQEVLAAIEEFEDKVDWYNTSLLDPKNSKSKKEFRAWNCQREQYLTWWRLCLISTSRKRFRL